MRSITWLTTRFSAILLALTLVAAAPADNPVHFATPEAAIEALVATARTGGAAEFINLFGKAGLQIVSSGDRVADQANRDKFIAAYDAKHTIEKSLGNGGAETAILSIGPDDWPFPIPLHMMQQGWFFDVAAGREEILDRRIGANELFVQQAVLAYVDAQNEYAQTLHDGNKLHIYAQRLISTPGKHDGLYWETAQDEPPSPLGELVADAQASGYRPGEVVEPFHGYYVHILTGQGSHAAGGAYDYVQKGMLLGGFGLIARPANWGNSGVMTFIVNQDGELYQKNLGPDSAKLAKAITSFDPDSSWQKAVVSAPIVGLDQGN